MHFTETESRIQNASSCFYTCTTDIICWKTAQRATHTSHSHFSLTPVLATISSSTLFGYSLFKFSTQHFNIFLSASSLKINQEGERRLYLPRKLRSKNFCKCICSWAEKDISEQLYSLRYDSIPQSSQQSKYCKWRRQLKINLMNDNYLYCIKCTDSKI